MGIWERIEKYTMPEPNSGCWLWSGACGSSGYPQLTVKDKETGKPKSLRIHKFICEQINNGDKNLFVLHKCDVKICINPDHLYFGTQKQNIIDAYSRNRIASKMGESSKLNKLTWESVAEIRNSNDTNSNLSIKYGVSRGRISDVRNMKGWVRNG